MFLNGGMREIIKLFSTANTHKREQYNKPPIPIAWNTSYLSAIWLQLCFSFLKFQKEAHYYLDISPQILQQVPLKNKGHGKTIFPAHEYKWKISSHQSAFQADRVFNVKHNTKVLRHHQRMFYASLIQETPVWSLSGAPKRGSLQRADKSSD